MDGSKKNGKGFAYILFTDAENATNAHKTMDGSIFQGRLLHVLPAAPKRENKLDEFAISKLPLKQQRQLRRKADATTMSFNWNSLFMNVRSASHQPLSISALLTFPLSDRCRYVLHIVSPWRGEINLTRSHLVGCGGEAGTRGNARDTGVQVLLCAERR